MLWFDLLVVLSAAETKKLLDKFKCDTYQNINGATLRSRCWVFTKVLPKRIDRAWTVAHR